ncbi:MAG: hypothetical protein IT572_10455 [Deltaproteobacteria bacterium]|nr:hypothetical protein [Deltaproteobacteria bacterium]
MVKVTGPTGPQGTPAAAPADAKAASSAPTVPGAQTPAKVPPDGFSQAAGGLLGYKSSPLVSGAVKIFSDGVVFPPNLLDTKDARNDPKYLRLLAAVLGLDDLEHYFYSLEGEKQEEYLAHKAKQREEKWAKVEREKEEKRRRKQGLQDDESDEAAEDESED